MTAFNSLNQLIGKTPLLRLENFEKQNGLRAKIFAKLEFFNPAGSVKDRAALAMIEQAEACGALQKGGTIVEPTSGNTGIAIAAIAAAKGYKTVIVMPENMSAERVKILKAYGAEVVLTSEENGMKGAIARAELIREARDGVTLGQFTNPENPLVHERTTAPEIWEDIKGEIDIFVAGVGTGGTVSGAGRYLKNKKPEIRVVAVEPSTQPPHGIQGIGAGFTPKILDKGVIDEFFTVSEEAAFSAARRFAKTQGLLIGISSGAALHAAVSVAKREENSGKSIAVVFPDSGERYLSTSLYIN
ncbi:MAG: cysteine synthase A [Clostridia bacterium]|nr:cysteine synthase A [Clostridia bacterium]